MEPTSATIESSISHEREVLENNVSELEQRARTSLSWRDRFDRSPGLMLGVAFGLHTAGPDQISIWWFVFLMCCLGAHWLFYKGYDKRVDRLSDWVYALAYGAAWAIVLPWAAQGYQPFIYFQF